MTAGAAPTDLSAAELRRRLLEAEDTLRAIRDGEADALVIRGTHEDAVFPLAGGQESYRAIMEAMDIGAIALDDQERVLYANTALCTLVGCGASDLQSHGLFSRLDGQSAETVRGTIALAREGRHQTQFVQVHEGRDRHLMVTAAPLPLPFGTGSALTFSDITARIEAAAAEESERIGQAVIASANEAVIVCDRLGRIINANAAVRAITQSDPMGMRLAEALPLTFPIGCGILHPDELVELANGGNSIKGLEAAAGLAAPGEPAKELLVSVAPLRLSGKMIGGCVITLVDLSERKAIEKRQTLLMHELDHRVKNTLTMVLSICGRTLSGAEDLEDFRTRFTRRIQALAATHNLLADASWSGVDLISLLRSELAPYLSGTGPHMQLRGLDCIVQPDVAIAFGLVVHELATNAVKYGALSRETGCVTVVGSQLDVDLFEVIWTESGGPAVATPTRHGFGQTLITRSLARGEGTGATVDFQPSGVVCRMVIPASQEP